MSRPSHRVSQQAFAHATCKRCILNFSHIDGRTRLVHGKKANIPPSTRPSLVSGANIVSRGWPTPGLARPSSSLASPNAACQWNSPLLLGVERKPSADNTLTYVAITPPPRNYPPYGFLAHAACPAVQTNRSIAGAGGQHAMSLFDLPRRHIPARPVRMMQTWLICTRGKRRKTLGTDSRFALICPMLGDT